MEVLYQIWYSRFINAELAWQSDPINTIGYLTENNRESDVSSIQKTRLKLMNSYLGFSPKNRHC